MISLFLYLTSEICGYLTCMTVPDHDATGLFVWILLFILDNYIPTLDIRHDSVLMIHRYHVHNHLRTLSRAPSTTSQFGYLHFVHFTLFGESS